VSAGGIPKRTPFPFTSLLRVEGFVEGFFEVPLADGPVLNPALSRKLELDFDLSLSLPSDDDREFSLPGILAHVRQTVEDQPRWKVRADVHLGIFSFAKHAMYADLDMNVDRFSSHPVLRAISGESEGIPEPVDNIPTAEHLDQNVSPVEVFQVLDADASQQEAVAAVKAGANLVIQGPPGTGKSQTIANIIAETLGQGKTVLFVSEKMAALRVVAKRLEEARLGEFCLEAHSQDVNKENIIRELERTLASDKSDPRQTVTDSRALIELEQLCQLRQDLNAYVRALHDASTPLGLSAFQVHGEIARRAAVPVASFPLSDVGALTPQRLARLESVVLRLASVGNVLLGAAEHPWLGCVDTTFTPQLRSELSEQLELLASHAERLDAAQSPLRVAWRLPPDPTRSGAHWLSQLVDLLDDRVDVPAHWFRSPSLAPLLTTANMYRTRMADCRSRKGSLLERYRPDIFSLELPQLQMSFSDSAASSWSFVRGTGTPADRVLAYQAPIRVAVEKASRSLTQLGRVATDLVARLGVEPATSLSDATRLRSLAGPALSNPRPTRAWFEPGRISTLRELGQEALKHQETVSTCRGQILKEFSDEFFDLATPQLLERFETKYGSWTRSLSPSYRRTLASLRRTLTQPEGLGYGQALVALKRARQITTSQAWLDGHREELVASFGLHFDGSNTD